MTRPSTPTRSLARGLALAAAVVMFASVADARPGGGRSFGSRGTRTFQAPPATRTAPAPSAPVARSAQPSPAGPVLGAAARPGGMFRGGFGPALLGGLVGAGLFGLLAGHGLLGGLTGLGSLFGLLLQVGLIVLVVRFALRFFRRGEPVAAGAAPLAREAVQVAPAPATPGHARASSTPHAAVPAGTDEVGLTPADFDGFERLLGDIQVAYGREDHATIAGLATPEMAGLLGDELAANAARGVVNRVSDPKLLRGDLAEAWREDRFDYATVAMSYALTDVTLDRNTGRVIEGRRDRPGEVTEVWTFARALGGDWRLSAIQPA